MTEKISITLIDTGPQSRLAKAACAAGGNVRDGDFLIYCVQQIRDKAPEAVLAFNGKAMPEDVCYGAYRAGIMPLSIHFMGDADTVVQNLSGIFRDICKDCYKNEVLLSEIIPDVPANADQTMEQERKFMITVNGDGLYDFVKKHNLPIEHFDPR